MPVGEQRVTIIQQKRETMIRCQQGNNRTKSQVTINARRAPVDLLVMSLFLYELPGATAADDGTYNATGQFDLTS